MSILNNTNTGGIVGTTQTVADASHSDWPIRRKVDRLRLRRRSCPGPLCARTLRQLALGVSRRLRRSNRSQATCSTAFRGVAYDQRRLGLAAPISKSTHARTTAVQSVVDRLGRLVRGSARTQTNIKATPRHTRRAGTRNNSCNIRKDGSDSRSARQTIDEVGRRIRALSTSHCGVRRTGCLLVDRSWTGGREMVRKRQMRRTRR